MKKPEAKRRTDVITPAEFEGMAAMLDGCFRDLLIASYDSRRRLTFASRLCPTRRPTAAKNRSGTCFLAWQFAPVWELHGFCPCEARWATAARHDW